MFRPPFPTSLDEITKLFGEINVPFARFRCCHLKPDRMEANIIAFGVTFEESFELCGAGH